MEPELHALLERARNDPEAVGLVLIGSYAAGTADDESDLDVLYVLRSGPLPEREREGRVELIPTSVEKLRSASSWELPALAHARVLMDETGEIAAVVDAARRVGRDELAELYDNYLNDFYRSLKAWRRGRELGARVKSSRSLWWLGQFLLALDGLRAPYPGAWTGLLGDLEPLMLEVARTSDPRRQQELQARVERIAAEHGFRDVYDAWNGDIDRVMEFRFE